MSSPSSEVLLRLTRDRNPRIRMNACAALSEVGDEAAIQRLLEMAEAGNETDSGVRRQAITGLGKLGQPALNGLIRLADLSEEEEDPEVRLQVLRALASASDNRKVAGALLRAASEDSDDRVRASALDYFRKREESTGYPVPADVEPYEYAKLGALVRAGARLSLRDIPWIRRLQLASANRRRDRRGIHALINARVTATTPMVQHIVVPVLATSAVTPLLAIALLNIFTGENLASTDAFRYLVSSAILAAGLGLVVPLFSRPAAHSPDRLWGAMTETTFILMWSLALAFAVALVVLTATTMPMGYRAILGVVVAIVPMIVAGRAGTLLAYGLSASERGRRTIQSIAGGVCAMSGLTLGLIGAWFAFDPADLSRWAAAGLLLVPASIALGVSFASVDAALEDVRAAGRRGARATALAVLSVPVLVVLIVAFSARQGVSDVLAASTQYGQPGTDTFRIQLGRSVPFRLAFPQRIEIVADTQEDLVLTVLAADGLTPIREQDDPEEIRNLLLQEGQYFVRVRQYGAEESVALTGRSLEEVSLAAVTRFGLGARDLGLLATGLSGNDGGVSISFATNLRSARAEDVDSARRLRGALTVPPQSPISLAPGPDNPVRYALIGEARPESFDLGSELSLPFCVGDVVVSTPNADLTSQEPEWQFVSGSNSAWRNFIPRDRLLLFPARPTRDQITQAVAYGQVYGTCGGPIVETPLSQALAFQEDAARLEGARASCGERPPLGSFHLWVEPSAIVGAGSIVRLIQQNADVDFEGFQLIDGYGLRTATPRQEYYWLRRDSTLCLGETWDPAWLAFARGVQERSATPTGSVRQIALSNGSIPPPPPSAVSPDSFSSLSINLLRARAASWWGEATQANDPVSGYFIVVEPDPVVGAGSIVQARSIAESGTVNVDVVHGWTANVAADAPLALPLSAVAPLGPSLDTTWYDLANNVARRSGQYADYPRFISQPPAPR